MSYKILDIPNGEYLHRRVQKLSPVDFKYWNCKYGYIDKDFEFYTIQQAEEFIKEYDKPYELEIVEITEEIKWR